MTNATNNEVGFDILSMQPLEEYNPDAVLYAVLNNTDHSVALGILVDYIKQGLQDISIPEDVVRTAAMEEAIRLAVEGISLPTIPTIEVTDENLADKVAQTQAVVDLKHSLDNIIQQLRVLEVPNLEGFIKVGEGVRPQKALVLNAAQVLVNANFGSSRLIYVVGRANVPSDAFMDGSQEAPFNTIQKAVDHAKSSSNSVILVQPVEGGGDYAGFVVDNNINVTVMGYGCTDAHMVKIVGSIENKGATSTRLRLKDLQIKQNNVNVPAYKSTGTQGRDYFKNITIEPVNNSQTTPVMVLEDVNNWIDFEDCNISGIVDIKGTAGPAALVAMRGGNSTTTHVQLGSEVKLLLNNCTRFGSVTQTLGTAEINYCHTFTGKAGVAIASTGGEVSLNFVNMAKPDGTFNKIQRALGATPIRIANSNVELAKVEGPVRFAGEELIVRSTDPVFDMSLAGVVEGVRAATVLRTATKGYFFEQLQGKIVQVAAGGNPATAENITTFDLTYADKTKVVEYPVGTGLAEVYLVLSDPENAGRTFTFGPFPN